MAITITKPTVGGNEDTWGSTLNTALDTIIDAVNGTSGTTAPNLSTLTINSVDVTATAAELNILDGVTATTAELNKIDGFTGVVADLNYAKDLRATGVTATEFDKLDGLTATTAELNKLDGVTATTAELNKLDGVTATTAELNYVDGVTSNIQTQLNAKGTMSSFVLEDGDGTEVSITNGKEVKFVEGSGIDINWTDTSTGSDTDPYDLTFSHSDTSSQASVNNSGNTFIQDITLDAFGHITGLTSATATSSSGTLKGEILAKSNGGLDYTPTAKSYPNVVVGLSFAIGNACQIQTLAASTAGTRIYYYSGDGHTDCVVFRLWVE